MRPCSAMVILLKTAINELDLECRIITVADIFQALAQKGLTAPL